MRFWNPEMEEMPRDRMRALQLEKLQAQLLRVYRESPYYKEKFDRASVNPEGLRSLEEFAAYPFFDKDEERESQERSRAEAGHSLGMHIVCDRRKVIRISSTSGTTGSPTYTGYTQKDREVANEVGARAMTLIGAQPGDVVMHAFVLDMWIAGSPVVDMLQNIGATVVPIGATSGARRFAQIAQDVFPDQLNCTPSYAQYLIAKLPEEAGIEAKDLGIRRVQVAGEPGGSIPEVRAAISEGFGGAEIYDVIGATGATFVSATSCRENTGMHFLADDYCLMELADPTTLEPVQWEDGAEGEIILTGLEKECAPIIRWRDKDIVQIFTEPCACGHPSFRFKVKGRADEMLLVRGVNVYPHAIKDVVNGFRPEVTGEIRIVLDAPPPVVQPPVQVKVEQAADLPAARADKLTQSIEERIHDLLRFRAKVNLIAHNTFERAVGATQKSELFERNYEG